MRIAILGAGAMGCLFGAYLTKENDVWLVDIDKRIVDAINENGVRVTEKDGEHVMRPRAVCDTSGLGEMDLVIVFVKSMHTESALAANKHLIGENTYVMTLQNGAGHEDMLLKFVQFERIIIGSTQHNSSLVSPGHVYHGGGGLTSIGLLNGQSGHLQAIADKFTSCGFNTVVSDNVKKQIWTKLMLNTSASVLTAVLQVKLGYILDNPHAWFLAEKLIKEAVAVANADGLDFDAKQVIGDIKAVLSRAYDGYTSIYADLRDGLRTEVDTISGSVLRAAKRLGLPVPYHEFVVELVHALEEKQKTGIGDKYNNKPEKGRTE